MRALIVDQDQSVLELIARGLYGEFDVDTVTTRADCIDLLRQNDYHVVLACDQLEDGSGLDLLTKLDQIAPKTLRIFAASPDRLSRLGARLTPFKLFQTVHYPLDLTDVRAALEFAAAAEGASADTTSIEHIVIGAEAAPLQPPRARRVGQGQGSAAALRVAAREPLAASAPSPVSHPLAVPAAVASARAVPASSPVTVLRPALSPPDPAVQAEPVSPPVSARADALTHAHDGRALKSPPALFGAPRGPAENVRRLALVAAVIAAGVATFLVVEQRGPVTTSAALLAPAAAPAPTAATTSAAPQIDELVDRIERALSHDDVATARTAIAALATLAPDYRRLAFLRTLLARRSAAQAHAHAPSAAPLADGADRSTAPLMTVLITAQAQKNPAPSADPGVATDPAYGSAEPAPALGAAPANPAAPPADAEATRFAGHTLEESAIPAGAAAAAAEAPAGLAHSPVSPTVTALRLLRRVAPAYPAAARAAGTEGYVDIELTVGRDAAVLNPVVIRSEPAGVFDAAALACVASWTFEPRRENGVPVQQRTQVRVDFKLER